MPKEKKLTKSELLELELHNERRLVKKLEKEKLAAKTQLISLEASILDLKRQIKLRDQLEVNRKIDQMKRDDEALKVEGQEIMDKIKNKYKIESEYFGFDPDTGEIREG